MNYYPKTRTRIEGGRRRRRMANDEQTNKTQ
jgi:hypothetical protein